MSLQSHFLKGAEIKQKHEAFGKVATGSSAFDEFVGGGTTQGAIWLASLLHYQTPMLLLPILRALRWRMRTIELEKLFCVVHFASRRSVRRMAACLKVVSYTSALYSARRPVTEDRVQNGSCATVLTTGRKGE